MNKRSNGTNADRRSSRRIDFEIDPEIMLPWYVNGTLPASEHRMLTCRMASRGDLQQKLVEEVRLQGVVQTEPSERLDVEAGMRRLAADLRRFGWGIGGKRAMHAGYHWLAAADRLGRNLIGHIATFLTVWPSRALAVTCVLQFAVIGIFAWTSYGPDGAPFVTLSEAPRAYTGPRDFVSFATGASITEISEFLSAHRLAVVSGPNTLGMFEVQIRTGSGRDELVTSEDAQKLKALLVSRPDLIDLVLDGRG
ncbi:MAG TPA: hypothetical protein VEJ16_18275 [Alphaproteobacteria bacterium]|nr:hypothetical protein [Alphaproteobacteria bacterium]